MATSAPIATRVAPTPYPNLRGRCSADMALASSRGMLFELLTQSPTPANGAEKLVLRKRSLIIALIGSAPESNMKYWASTIAQEFQRDLPNESSCTIL